jgi:serine/threonine-protein kinase
VIATGSQPRVTPPPSGQRFSDTMAAPGMARPVTAARAAAVKPATQPPEDTALPEAAPQSPQSPAQSIDPYVGHTIADRYKVLKKLGEGGMGVVYLAEHVFIEKKVALKVLSEDFARKADLVARFMQEAKAASKIGHENIVDITDFGETSSGSVFFAMEFLDGQDLAGHIRSGGAMPFARARHIMNQICRALGAAHAKGIIHRDMKPENVYLVTREGKPDFVKILDFGIAKMSGLDDAGSRLTRTGMIFGTPEYMSPEQAKGDRPDHRVDIYAAGCILYEMLTGDVPFHAETFMGVLTKHMFETPEPPSVRNPEAQIPAEVEAVVLQALAKDRDQRFQTMKEMAMALEACAGGDPTRAWGNEPSHVGGLREASQTFTAARGTAARGAVRPTSVPSGPAAPPRKKTGLVVGGAVAALLIGGTGAAVILTKKKPEPPPAPVAQPEPPKPMAAPPPVETPKPVERAKPSKYTMTINTEPSGADVFNGPERLGTTPAQVVLPASEATVTLTLKKHGYKDQSLKVVADKDHDFLVDLAQVGRPHSSRSASKPSTPLATQPPPQPQPKPAEPAQPKPAGKLRDLKDPFAN